MIGTGAPIGTSMSSWTFRSVATGMISVHSGSPFLGATGSSGWGISSNPKSAFPLPPPEADAQSLPGGGSAGYRVYIPLHGAQDLLPSHVVVDFTVDRGKEDETVRRPLILRRASPGSPMRLTDNWGNEPSIMDMMGGTASAKDLAVLTAMVEEAEKKAVRMLLRAVGSAFAASLSMEEAEESVRDGFAVSIMEG